MSGGPKWKNLAEVDAWAKARRAAEDRTTSEIFNTPARFNPATIEDPSDPWPPQVDTHPNGGPR
jgi:hypothetical protein